MRKNYEACLRAKLTASLPIEIFVKKDAAKLVGLPDYDPLAKGNAESVRKGYVVVTDKVEKKIYYFKKEEYRKYLSFHSDFPVVKA